MAITVTETQVGTAGFALNATSADASGCEELKAAPGAGKRLCLNTVMLAVESSLPMTVTIGQGETGSAVTTPILGPVPLTCYGPVVLDFARPLCLGANTALTVDASGAGVVTVFCEGYVD